MKKPVGFSSLTGYYESWASLRDELSRVAVYDFWYNGSSWGPQSPPTKKTESVGSKEANALGLHDMSGNVREWCWDWHGTVVPGQETDPAGAASGSDRVLRGGSWFGSASSCAVGARYKYSPADRSRDFGFRLTFRR